MNNDQPEMEKTKASFPILKDTSLILFLISAYGVIVSYVYELGLCSGFGLPITLISLGAETLLISIGSTLLSFVIYAIYVVPIIGYLINSKHKFLKEVGYWCISLSIPGFIGFTAGFDTPSFRASLTFMLYSLIIRWQTTSGEKPFISKEEYEEGQYKFHFGLLSKLPKGLALLTFTPILALYFFHTYGLNRAYGKKERAVLIRDKEAPCILAKRLGDSFVCVEYNPANNTISPSWTIVPIEGIKAQNIEFKLNHPDS